MIAASDPVEYIPSGQLIVLRHPESESSSSFKQRRNFLVTLCEKYDCEDGLEKSKEFWHLRGHDEYQEEELFCSGKLAVHSKGSQAGTNSSQTCYSCDTNIEHAIWCKFYLENKEGTTKYTNLPSSENDDIDCICLVDSYTLRVFTENGENYISSLHFKVSNLWSIKYGILLEKAFFPTCSYNITSMDTGKNMSAVDDINTPAVFSLSHPLDEVWPVLLKHGGITYMWDTNQRILFTSSEPSIALIYDMKTNLHSIYKIRKASTDECQQISRSLENTSPFFNSVMSPCFKNSSNPMTFKNKTFYSTLASTPFHSKTTSYATSGSASVSMSSHYLSKSHSPMATISRCQSPTHPVISGSSLQTHYPKTHHSLLASSMGQSDRFSGNFGSIKIPYSSLLQQNFCPTQSTLPEICLEHIWTENIGGDISAEQAHKVFLTTDLVGQTYLCYLIQSCCRLSLVRLEKSRNPNQIILGMVTTLIGKDAINLPKLNMIAIIEIGGNIILYSGTSPIGKLYIPSLLPNSLGNSYILPPFQHKELLSPYPRRSSLISPNRSRTPDRKFEEGLHLLSPVSANYIPINVTDNSIMDPGSISLKSSMNNKFVLEYGSGNYYKISLPNLETTPLVSNCLKTLRKILPRELAMQFLSKWYVSRNAPGPQDMTLSQEWNLFLTTLLTFLGYELNKVPIICDQNFDYISDRCSPTIVSKKQKTACNGSHNDWNYILNLTTPDVKTYLTDLLGFNESNDMETESDFVSFNKESQENSNKLCLQSNFAQYLHQILYAFHLLYEEIKLSKNMSESHFLLAQLLYQFSNDLSLNKYTNYYLLDFPSLESMTSKQKIDLDSQKISVPMLMVTEPPSIFQTLYDILNQTNFDPYPYLQCINVKSKNVIELFSMFNQKKSANIFEMDCLFKTLIQSIDIDNKSQSKTTAKEVIERMVKCFHTLGMTKYDIQNLPAGVAFILSNVVHQCRENPPSDWPSTVYELVDRQDLSALQKKTPLLMNSNQYTEENSKNKPLFNEVNHSDGMEFDYTLLKLRFNNDHRVREVRRLLNSSEPVKITIIQRPDVSDHEFIEEQEKFLLGLCTRTMALPIGRGMFTLRTAMPINTEQLPIPKLCLNGKAPPRGTTVELSHIDVPNNMNLWPLFHNGVATGLCIHPKASNVDSTWIVYNKQQQGEFGIEHSGFLMALGLNGHLKNLAPFSMYEYLVECHETTSVGLLLGLSATHRGTMDVSMTKLLSLHVETLLPPTSIELNVQQNVQVAALMGVGLVYQQTNHRHIAHALLSEIGRPPGPEMKNCVDRESYSLAAGLALGLVVLGSGGGSDLSNIPDSLHYYMVGGNIRPFCGSQKDKYKSPSYQIREGDSINIDVTSPGATIALGLMYLKTGNHAVAEWMSAPNTQYLLDFVRPDLLLLRILAKSLILYDEMEPSKTWVSSHVPEIVRKYKLQKPTSEITEPIDLETINQAYCNIIAGACMALGLKYAGTENIIAFKTLYHFLKMFMTLAHKTVAELAGKATVETCVNVVLLATSIVMAGTGNIELLRMIRYLRTRVGTNNSVVTYGSQVCIHMALGFLFLGGGSYTLSNHPTSIAALIIALFPKFPTHSNDNRYHLQALRHFYVLATDFRLLLPKDIDNGQFCYAAVRLTYKPEKQSEGQKLILRAPCLLPQLDRLVKVQIDDDRYWKIIFELERNFDQLKNILETYNYLNVKQKAGCLSYTDDPQGFRTLLAQTLTTEEVIVWTAWLNQITSFTTEKTILSFVKHFLENNQQKNSIKSISKRDCDCDFQHNINYLCFINTLSCESSATKSYCNQICEVILRTSSTEKHFAQILIAMVYECVVRDKINFLPLWIGIYKTIRYIEKEPNINLTSQMRFLLNHRMYNDYGGLEKLLNMENVIAMKQQLSLIMDKWEKDISLILRKLAGREPIRVDNKSLSKLASYVIHNQISYETSNDLANYLSANLFENKSLTCSNVYGMYKFHKLFKNC